MWKTFVQVAVWKDGEIVNLPPTEHVDALQALVDLAADCKTDQGFRFGTATCYMVREGEVRTYPQWVLDIR